MTNIALTYTSVEHLLDVAQHGTLASHRMGHNNGADAGTYSFAEAEQLYRDGWTPGLDTLRSSMERIDLPNIDLTRVRLRMDVAGGSVDMGRYLGNDPECMRRIVMAPSKPVVRILVCAGYAWYHGVDKVLANGAPLVALCELLAAGGFGIEIDAVSIQAPIRALPDGRDDRLRTVIRVKQANEPIDLGSFAFAIAHPSFNRRFIWGAWEVESKGETWAYEYGIPGAYGVNRCEADLARFAREGGYDIDLSGYPVEPANAVDRVVNAVKAWQNRVTGDE